MTNTGQNPTRRRWGPGLRETMTHRPAYGILLVAGSAMLTEAAAYSGIDWAVIDMEAAPMTRADALHQAQALAGSEVAALIRVPSLARHPIEYALDLGVAGVMVPKVDDAEDAGRAAGHTRYPPQGNRGVNPIRAGGYYSETARYFESANQEVLCIVQIESREAVSKAHDIAATPGIDLLFIGTNDLAMDFGQPGNPTGPAFDEARKAVLTACAAAGKPAGIFAMNARLARQYAKEGFRFIALGNEIKFFLEATRMTINMLRRQ